MFVALTSSELAKLDEIQKNIASGTVSDNDISWLESHKEEVKVFGDSYMADLAGISEEEFWETQQKMEGIL